MTTFALYATLALYFGYIGQRAWTLFFQRQDATGRIIDALLAATYACCITGLWPLLP